MDKPDFEKMARATLRLIRLRDWAWKGGGSDVRVMGSHGRLAARALGLPETLPSGWPSEDERAEIESLTAAIRSEAASVGGGE